MNFKTLFITLFLFISLAANAQDTLKNITLPDFIVVAQKDPEY